MNPGQDVWDAQMDDYDDYSDDYNREQTKSSTSQGTKAAKDHVPSELPELSSDLVCPPNQVNALPANACVFPSALPPYTTHGLRILLLPERMGRNACRKL